MTAKVYVNAASEEYAISTSGFTMVAGTAMKDSSPRVVVAGRHRMAESQGL
jgi:hypothetical protein